MKNRAIWAAGVLAAAAVIAPTPAWASAKPAVTGEIGFQGTAYGSEATVGSVISSGRSAVSSLGCTSSTGTSKSNTAAGLNTAVASAGTIHTSTQSETTPDGVASTSTTTVQNVSLLGGLVTVGALTSESTTSENTTTGALTTDASGTVFSNLKVGGLPVLLTIKKDTKITLPGVGYLELNQQTGSVNGKSGHLNVLAVHVVVNLNTPLAPLGTNIVIGYASSGLGSPAAGLLSGLAYGAHAKILGGTLLAGELFAQGLGCGGTNGVTKTSSGVGISAAPLLSSGTITDTANGVSNASQVTGTVTSTIQGVNLGGLIKADAINASVSADGNPPTLTDNSSFANLTVSGFPSLSLNPAPNTKLRLAGLGTLWLHRVIKTGSSIKVIMIQLDVTAAGNVLGLATGSQVNVGYASVGVK